MDICGECGWSFRTGVSASTKSKGRRNCVAFDPGHREWEVDPRIQLLVLRKVTWILFSMAERTPKNCRLGRVSSSAGRLNPLVNYDTPCGTSLKIDLGMNP